MKSNFFNKKKLSCKTIAMILVFAIVIVSVDGCGKSERSTGGEIERSAKMIQVDTAMDRIPAEPIEEAALALNEAFEKLESSTGDDAVFAENLQNFRGTLMKYQSVYEETEGEKDNDYRERIEKALRQAEELENAESTDRERQMNRLRKYMGESESAHTYGDQLIEGAEPEVETQKVESFEAYAEEMESTPEDEGQKTDTRQNLLTEKQTALSDAMKKKAEELKTPLAVYNELKNTLQYENYYGSRKGAEATYDALSGNDVDQASVLIAMLRYLGYEAVYAEGDILLDTDQAMALTGAGNVTAAANALALGGKRSTILVAGGKAVGVSIHHTWARTLVPYGDYRGAGKNSGDKRWIDLDVSIKQYEDTEKNIYDDGAGLGIDRDAVLEEYKQGSTDMLEALLNDEEIAQKAEGMYAVRKKIRQQTVAYLPLSLPYSAENVQCYDKIEDGQSDRIRITVGNASLGTYTSSELYGKRIVMEYCPATKEDEEQIRQAGGIFRAAADRVQMVPVLKIDGEAAAEGEPVSLGSTENMTIKVFSGNTSYSSDNRVTAGSIYQFSIDTQSITPVELEKARLEAEAVKEQVNTDNVYSDEYMGALLKYAGTMYFAQVDVANRLLAEANEIVSVRNLSVGITEYEVCSISAMGRVVGIQEGSLCIDVDMDVHSRTSLRLDEEACVSHSLAYGMTASRYEDVIWNEFTGQDCISTMSIFERAEKEGIDLVILNEKSYNDDITRVSADKNTLSAVKSAVNKGFTVIIPEHGMEWDDWEGTGYLILNPETGAGEYMISGGLSGGSTSTAVTIAGICAIIAQLAMITLMAMMAASLLMASFGVALLVQIINLIFLVWSLVTLLFVCDRTGDLIEVVAQYASGDPSGEEYILQEFWQTTLEVATMVLLHCVFKFIDDRTVGGSTGGKTEGEGTEGNKGGSGENGGNEGTTGTGETGGSSETGGDGGSGTGGTGNGTGDNGGTGTGEGTETGGSSEAGGSGSGEGAGGAETKIKFPENDAQIKHIFGDRDGHVVDTPENRQMLLEVANNSDNYLGRDANGNDWYAIIADDGTQTWVRVRNEVIINAGVNNVPRGWDSETGLNRNPKK